MKRYALSVTTAIAVVALSLPVVVQAGYSFTTGAEYTSGDYGTDVETTAWQIPFTLGYAGKRTFFSITVPYIRVDGSTAVSGVRSFTTRGPGGISTQTETTTTTEERTDAGLGDVTLRASYQLQNETPERPWLGVTGKVKLGTADEDKNLGTGENDYSLQLDMAKGPLDGIVGYTVLGDTNAIDYDNIFYGAIGYSAPLQDKWKVRGEFYTEQEAVDGVDPVRELTLSLSKPLGAGRSISLYGIKGLSDSSPEWGAGVMVTSSF
jgi:hypothetical protein